ncbi:6,7-dimethyl-8-ribityllumazine synthase [Patescibacteria group bacterium]
MSKRRKKPKLLITDGKDLDGKEIRIGVVRSIYNEIFTEVQLNEAKQCLDEYGVDYDTLDVYGSYEITYALQQLAQTGNYDGLVALGCLIKGETIHFNVVTQAVALSMSDLIIKHDIPIGFGVITANTRDQARERTWFGYDATYATLDSIIMKRSLGK